MTVPDNKTSVNLSMHRAMINIQQEGHAVQHSVRIHLTPGGVTPPLSQTQPTLKAPIHAVVIILWVWLATLALVLSHCKFVWRWKRTGPIMLLLSMVGIRRVALFLILHILPLTDTLGIRGGWNVSHNLRCGCVYYTIVNVDR